MRNRLLGRHGMGKSKALDCTQCRRDASTLRGRPASSRGASVGQFPVDRVVVHRRVRRAVCVAGTTVDAPPEEAFSPLGRRHPGTVHPRRIVAYVPLMTTCEVRHPVALLVPVVPRNLAFHIARPLSCADDGRTASSRVRIEVDLGRAPYRHRRVPGLIEFMGRAIE